MFCTDFKKCNTLQFCPVIFIFHNKKRKRQNVLDFTKSQHTQEAKKHTVVNDRQS